MKHGCHSCEFFAPGENYPSGLCRRNAPVAGIGWPLVAFLDICGQYRLRNSREKCGSGTARHVCCFCDSPECVVRISGDDFDEVACEQHREPLSRLADLICPQQTAEHGTKMRRADPFGGKE